MKKLRVLIIVVMLAVILVANVQAQCDGGPTPSGPTPWPAGRGGEKASGVPAMCPVVKGTVDFSQG
jgi:hypothetical protein